MWKLTYVAIVPAAVRFRWQLSPSQLFPLQLSNSNAQQLVCPYFSVSRVASLPSSARALERLGVLEADKYYSLLVFANECKVSQ